MSSSLNIFVCHCPLPNITLNKTKNLKCFAAEFIYLETLREASIPFLFSTFMVVIGAGAPSGSVCAFLLLLFTPSPLKHSIKSDSPSHCSTNSSHRANEHGPNTMIAHSNHTLEQELMWGMSWWSTHHQRTVILGLQVSRLTGLGYEKCEQCTSIAMKFANLLSPEFRTIPLLFICSPAPLSSLALKMLL